MHSFHIPVLGLGYSVDTPIKVSPFGISSVASIVDDEMIERMRKYHAIKSRKSFVPIKTNEPDFRSRRITAYLNLMDEIIDDTFNHLRREPFGKGTGITRYFELLPCTSPLKKPYVQWLNAQNGDQKAQLEQELRASLVKGSIDVNIMSKVDKMNKSASGEMLGDEDSDASAALRGFAQSTLASSLVLSAGMNPRLYGYLEKFRDFYPDEKGRLKKKIILKVSDFRSAFIQAKFLAKKGIWISEFRIESGLNCGGHAFATDGYLLGPILEEFKTKRKEMSAELFAMYQTALATKGLHIDTMPALLITVQGGIGTAKEHEFLLRHYGVDAAGWGSPFLLVPEVTNVDADTLNDLVEADSSDYYVSDSSPLGVLFNNFRNSSAEKDRLARIAKGRPGSPCKKKYLVSNTEFTEEPICLASREYQHLKLNQLKSLNLEAQEYEIQANAITQKICLCDGLSTSTLLKNNLLAPRENKSVAICPGPNLAWFSRTYSLEEMAGHIYGKTDLLAGVKRPNMFINELTLYVEYYIKERGVYTKNPTPKKLKYLQKFAGQILAGIDYYRALVEELTNETDEYRREMQNQLVISEDQVRECVMEFA
ncbi:hypothetical protein [Persicitalea jodogahamensis]|uniref:Uncharacterized protein n=1 Tax=Persicitalea jodogahamensis TaxID=402147 RepID=A0A8J3G729_9BACT|nr:hypothetical protein [Persicitalea jodogahamensis]GHB52473.1 hypothetical protein GCM10007390_01410 [Persicitalea jodogahamensis]